MSDLLFADSERQSAYKIRVLLKQQHIRKIMPRVYSFDPTSPLVTIVRNMSCKFWVPFSLAVCLILEPL